MRRHLGWFAAALAAWAGVSTVEASWVFRPSYYTHDPASGERVAQFAPGVTPYQRGDATYQQSGYRHMQSTLRGSNGSADRTHIVETWGAGESIRPYGEWLRPYRAGATPYGPWGNPQGPWTSPFGSWVNPYGLGRYAYPPHGWGYGHPGYAAPRPGRPHVRPRGGPGGPGYGLEDLD